MLTDEQIDAAVKRLVAGASIPPRVIIFGSYARGDADKGSDVGVGLPLVSAHEFERRSQVPGTVAYRARREGKMLREPPP